MPSRISEELFAEVGQASAPDVVTGHTLIGAAVDIVPRHLRGRRRPLEPDLFDELMRRSWVTAEHATASIDALVQCTQAVREALERFTATVRRTTVPVNALPRSELRLRRAPLFVSVEQDEDDTFIAEITEVGAVGYGESVGEAVDGAVLQLCDLYDEIAHAAEGSLGPKPRRWQAALRHLIERVDG